MLLSVSRLLEKLIWRGKFVPVFLFFFYHLNDTYGVMYTLCFVVEFGLF